MSDKSTHYAGEILRLMRALRLNAKLPRAEGIHISRSLLRKIGTGERALTERTHLQLVASLDRLLARRLAPLRHPAAAVERAACLARLGGFSWIRLDRRTTTAQVVPAALLALASDRIDARAHAEAGRLHVVIRLNRPLPAFSAKLLGTSVQPRQVSVRMNRLLRELLRFGGPGAAWSPCAPAAPLRSEGRPSGAATLP